VLLQNSLQVELLFVVEVEVLALRLGLGSHHVRNGCPVSPMLPQCCNSNSGLFIETNML
jgi:hypothetical protein